MSTDMDLPATPSQTVGPFLRIGLEWLSNAELVSGGTPGERVTIEGRVLDADGAPVPDAVVELWQANAQGQYAQPADSRSVSPDSQGAGFARIPTDEAGGFRFTTIKPGRVPAPDGSLQAPHIVVTIFMRGLLRHLVSRIYFPDEAANAEDMVLALVPAERRRTLIARRAETGEAALTWNVVLQGAEETVFFAV
jgi:protocatechuate 3,4-dioxygenase alpha subunit